MPRSKVQRGLTFAAYCAASPLFGLVCLAICATGAAGASPPPTRRHVPGHNGTLEAKLDPLQGEVCAGKAGRANFVEGGNPLVMEIKIDGPTADGEQTSAFVSANPSHDCSHELGDTTKGKTVATAIGDAPKVCWTCTDGVTAEGTKVRDCITKVVSKFWPFNKKDWALPCRDPDGKPLDESRTWAWNRFFSGVNAETDDYVGSISDAVTAAEGRLEDGTVKIIGGGQEGADFVAIADVPSMETKDGTKVGELTKHSWSVHALSAKTGDPVATMALVEDGKALRSDVTVSDDGMTLSGQAFRVHPDEPWHKFVFTAEAVPMATGTTMKRLLLAPGRRDGVKPIAYETTFIVNAAANNNKGGGGNGGINQIAVAIGASALCLILVLCGWMWLNRNRQMQAKDRSQERVFVPPPPPPLEEVVLSSAPPAALMPAAPAAAQPAVPASKVIDAMLGHA